MQSTFLPRLALRQSRWMIQRRAASTTEQATQKASETANTAKEKASEATSKAQQGLSRVTSSAGNVASRVSNAAGDAVSSATGRAGRYISWVQARIPTAVYYARVGGELAKMIYRGRNMQPPSMQTVQGYLTPVTNALRNPSSLMSRGAGAAEGAADTAVNNPQSVLQRLRDMDSATLLAVGIIGAETIGFFSVGEMIGRMKIIGYRGGQNEHH